MRERGTLYKILRGVRSQGWTCTCNEQDKNNKHTKLPESSSLDIDLVPGALLFPVAEEKQGLQGEKARGLSDFLVPEKRFSSQEVTSRCSRQGSALLSAFKSLPRPAFLVSGDVPTVYPARLGLQHRGCLPPLSEAAASSVNYQKFPISPGNSPKIPSCPRGV